jgi:fatty acid desaturase
VDESKPLAVGASSFMWRQQHVVGHHAYTNVEGVDPDIRCAPEKDIRRVNEMQPHEGYHPFQHVYLFFAYGLLSFKVGTTSSRL